MQRHSEFPSHGASLRRPYSRHRRSKNALLALHALLYFKKHAVSKIEGDMYYLPNPKSGSLNLVEDGFGIVQRFKVKKA